MIQRILRRYSKNKMSSQRRQHSKEWSLFIRFQEFRVRMKYGRRKPIHWWRKS
jgi:hypothetical protein